MHEIANMATIGDVIRRPDLPLLATVLLYQYTRVPKMTEIANVIHHRLPLFATMICLEVYYQTRKCLHDYNWRRQLPPEIFKHI